MAEPKPEINCPIFLKREWTIKELTRDINEAKAVSDKAERAVHLKNEVEMLLSCEKYDKKNENCKNCRIISKLRKQTAELLLKVKELGGK
ncbi:MAG: hypothetical protein KKF52_00730 [Nanoarchaeota archaeon]|nr:hypothetical protein [Nanoarchaeota archaeon]MBU4349676.1 hypothetical protein [bacterium]